MAETAIKNPSRRKFEGIDWLIGELQAAKKDFTKNTLAQNYELDMRFEKLIKFIHADRSYDANNYSPLDIEVELVSRHHELRRHMLRQIIAKTEQGAYLPDSDLTLRWNDFVYAKKQDFGSWGPRDTGWSSEGLAEKAADAVFPSLFGIIEYRLRENKFPEIRDDLLLMLSGIRARYNRSTPQFKTVDALLKTLDPQNKYKHKYK